jgi:glycosyltransferase involved in cell wall biosynthesis
MAAGTPVVATRAGALPEVLGDAAVLVDVGDVDQLADGLSSVIDDEALGSELVGRGRARVAHYDWNRCVDGLVDIYHRAIERA